MKREPTLYEVLEVSPHASALIIRAAYRCLTQLTHPDKRAGTDEASDRQAQINYAYSVLSDPDKRQRYNQALELLENPVDRRGSGVAAQDSASPDHKADEPRGARPFAFRPLA